MITGPSFEKYRLEITEVQAFFEEIAELPVHACYEGHELISREDVAQVMGKYIKIKEVKP